MKYRSSRQQQGSALLVALLLMVAVTIVSLTTMQSNTTEMRMASNSQFKMEAFQNAQAAADYIVMIGGTTKTSLFPVLGAANTKISCTVTATSQVSGCPAFAADNSNKITWPTSPLPPWDANNYAFVTMLTSAEGALPPRFMETSGSLFASIYFGLESHRDQNSSGQGNAKAGVSIGLMKLIPKL